MVHADLDGLTAEASRTEKLLVKKEPSQGSSMYRLVTFMELDETSQCLKMRCV